VNGHIEKWQRAIACLCTEDGRELQRSPRTTRSLTLEPRWTSRERRQAVLAEIKGQEQPGRLHVGGVDDNCWSTTLSVL
jgi:hypothetical protein